MIGHVQCHCCDRIMCLFPPNRDPCSCTSLIFLSPYCSFFFPSLNVRTHTHTQHLILPSHRKLRYINRYRKCLVYEMWIAVYACHAHAYHIMSYNNNIQMDGDEHMRCCATFDARTSEIACHQMKPKARVNVTYDTKFTLQKESKSTMQIQRSVAQSVLVKCHYYMTRLASANCLMTFHIHLKWLWNMLDFSHGDIFERTGEDKPTSISFCCPNIRFAWLVGFALDHEEEENSIFIVCCCNPMLCLPCVKPSHQRSFTKWTTQRPWREGNRVWATLMSFFTRYKSPYYSDCSVYRTKDGTFTGSTYRKGCSNSCINASLFYSVALVFSFSFFISSSCQFFTPPLLSFSFLVSYST